MDLDHIPRLAPTNPEELGRTKKAMSPASLANLRPPWKPGDLPNPGGKPTKSRNRLQGDFVRRLADDFERFGIYAIARVRRSDPASYVRVVASLMPKEVTVTHDAIDELSDDQLDAAIAAVRAVLAAKGDGDSAGEAQGRESAEPVSAISETS